MSIETHSVSAGNHASVDDSLQFDCVPIVIGEPDSHRDYLRRAVSNRSFIVRYPLTVLRAKYRETVLGLGWEILNPSLLVLTWWLIRGVAFPRAGGPDYLAFLIVGIFTYQYMQRMIIGGAAAVGGASGLMQKFNFPPIVAPLQNTVSSFASNTIGIAVMLTFVMLSGTLPTWTWLLLIPMVLAETAFALGGSLALARFTTGNRDAKNVIPFVFRLTFYASGIIFPIEERIADLSFRWVFDLNPFYAITATARTVVMGSPLHATTLVSALAWCAIMPVAGYFIFRTGDHKYAE
jgi:teichoic acid transport system permease protein